MNQYVHNIDNLTLNGVMFVNEVIPNKTLYCHLINTPLGKMLAVSDENYLYMLEFLTTQKLSRQLIKLQKALNKPIAIAKSTINAKVEEELSAYFGGSLNKFSVALNPLGTPFQQLVWQQLQQIPYGVTISYLDLAKNIGNKKAFRAAANANGKNPIAIIIPCHRVILSDGNIGGYAGGVDIKIQLLKAEQNKIRE